MEPVMTRVPAPLRAGSLEDESGSKRMFSRWSPDRAGRRGYRNNGDEARQPSPSVLNRTRCRCRRGHCPSERRRHLPHSGRCRFWTTFDVEHRPHGFRPHFGPAKGRGRPPRRSRRWLIFSRKRKNAININCRRSARISWIGAGPPWRRLRRRPRRALRPGTGGPAPIQ